MTRAEAVNLLDARREGAEMPDAVVRKALLLTGDIEPPPTLAEYLMREEDPA